MQSNESMQAKAKRIMSRDPVFSVLTHQTPDEHRATKVVPTIHWQPALDAAQNFNSAVTR